MMSLNTSKHKLDDFKFDTREEQKIDVGPIGRHGYSRQNPKAKMPPRAGRPTDEEETSQWSSPMTLATVVVRNEVSTVSYS